MTVPSTYTPAYHAGNGVTTTFPFTFRILEASSLEVITVDAAGVETEISTYTLTGVGSYTGGSVILPAPLASGWHISIKRRTNVDQGTSFRGQGAFFAESHEDAFDKLTMNLQEQEEQIGRAFLAPPTGGPYDVQLPTPEAGYALGWDATGTKLENVPNTGANQSADLANTTSSVKGAGMVGYDGTHAYEPDTVGDHLNSIAASSGSSMVGFLQSGTGAVARTLQAKGRDSVSVKDFGAVGDGIADDTEAIQKCINAVSNSMRRIVYFPAGRYNYTRLYCYYDAALNPGYNNTGRQSKITFKGDGVPTNYHSITGGSSLYCTSTTGDGVAVSPVAADDGATTLLFPSRDFVAEGISFEGVNSGYLVSAYGVPGFRLSECQFVVSNAAGSGLRVSSAWIGLIEKTNFSTHPYGFNTTGKAIVFSSTLPGGLFTIRDCGVSDKYAYGLHHVSGEWQNLSIVDSEIAGSTYAIYASAAIQLLSIRGCYFEGACTSFIADASTNCILGLSVKDSWFLSSALTGPAINLKAPNCVDISASFVQDQEITGKAFLNIDSTVQPGQTQPHRVSNVVFVWYSAPVATTLFTGIIPQLDGIDYYLGNPLTTLYTAGKYPIRSYIDGSSSGYHFAAHHCDTKILDYGPILGSYVGILTNDASGVPSFVHWYAASGNPTFRLPSAAYMAAAYLPAGVSVTATNNMNSGSYGIVTDGEASPTTKGQIQPGAQRKFVWTGTTWI